MMKRKISKAILVVSICAGLSMVGFAQDISRHFISVKSGMVNYVEGKPELLKAKDGMKRLIAVRQQLMQGDRILTGEEDRVELLLNPGSYLRISGGSELEVNSTEFEAMRYTLKSGSAILESMVFNKKIHSLWISTPAGELCVTDPGLFRVEATPNRRVEVAVQSGKLQWLQGENKPVTLKKGKKFLLPPLNQDQIETASIPKGEMDSFDLWSKNRDAYLMTANTQIPSWMRNTVYSSYSSVMGGGWFFSPLYGTYTFLPYSGYLISPYNYRYYNYDPYFYYGHYGNNATNYGSGSNSSGSTNNGYAPSAAAYESRSSVSSTVSAPAARASTGSSEVSGRASTRNR
jgi:hypothetical protein